VLILGRGSLAARALERALSQEGHQVDTAGGAPHQILTRLRQEQPEVIVMEKPLPGATALELSQLLEASPEALVVVLDTRQGVARFCFGGFTPLNDDAGIRHALQVRRLRWSQILSGWKGGKGDEG